MLHRRQAAVCDPYPVCARDGSENRVRACEPWRSPGTRKDGSLVGRKAVDPEREGAQFPDEYNLGYRPVDKPEDQGSRDAALTE